MDDGKRDIAKLLADVLEKKGIVSDDPPLKPSIKAMQAAQDAYIAIGEGTISEWRELMKLRQIDENEKKHINCKMVGFCKRALRQKNLDKDFRERVQFSCGYFSGKVDA